MIDALVLEQLYRQFNLAAAMIVVFFPPVFLSFQGEEYYLVSTTIHFLNPKHLLRHSPTRKFSYIHNNKQFYFIRSLVYLHVAIGNGFYFSTAYVFGSIKDISISAHRNKHEIRTNICGTMVI
jgi:hypothetical protein